MKNIENQLIELLELEKHRESLLKVLQENTEELTTAQVKKVLQYVRELAEKENGEVLF